MSTVRHGEALPSWSDIVAKCEPWLGPRRQQPDDIPLILYRDANSWCPFCHRVWFFLELKGLRFETERIHLRGDPAEPPKQGFYKKMVPSGAVPALRINDEVVVESLDILYRLERDFPDTFSIPDGQEVRVRKLARASLSFNTDDCSWLHNTSLAREAALREDVLQRLRHLENALAESGGPYLCGSKPSLAEAAYVGFLTRCAHNYLYFKRLDIRNPAEFPHLSSWFEAMERLPAYQATKQDAYFEQRIYQAHPSRRMSAEPCMQLGQQGSCVGEPDCSIQPPPPAAPLEVGSIAAMEAACALHRNCKGVATFLLRKAPGDTCDIETVEKQLQAIAAVLVGLPLPPSCQGVPPLAECVQQLGFFIGTPRDMSSAAAAQVRGALQAMRQQP